MPCTRSSAPRSITFQPASPGSIGPALINREKALIKDIPAGLARAMDKRGVEVIAGSATFAAPDTIRVGSRLLQANHIVIATGSKPRSLPIPGAEHMITSDEILSDRVLPGSAIFIGGGVISFELGNVYARAGVQVTIFEALPQLLPALDVDAVARLRAESERIGIRFMTDVVVKRIEQADGTLRAIFTSDDGEHVAEADRVVNGAGRIANIDQLDLAAGGIAHDHGRVTVETVAWSKIIVDRATDRILGAHFVGHEGQELINVFGLVIKFDITSAPAERSRLRLSDVFR
jgi:glutathione reductase (NADPH)